MDKEIIDKVIQYIDVTKDFILENAPSFFQEIVQYGRFMSLILGLLFPILTVLFTSLLWHHLKNIKRSSERSSVRYGDLEVGCAKHVVFSIIYGIVAFIFFINFLANFQMSILAWTSPKIYILKFIKA